MGADILNNNTSKEIVVSLQIMQPGGLYSLQQIILTYSSILLWNGFPAAQWRRRDDMRINNRFLELYREGGLVHPGFA